MSKNSISRLIKYPKQLDLLLSTEFFCNITAKTATVFSLNLCNEASWALCYLEVTQMGTCVNIMSSSHKLSHAHLRVRPSHVRVKISVDLINIDFAEKQEEVIIETGRRKGPAISSRRNEMLTQTCKMLVLQQKTKDERQHKSSVYVL